MMSARVLRYSGAWGLSWHPRFRAHPLPSDLPLHFSTCEDLPPCFVDQTSPQDSQLKHEYRLHCASVNWWPLWFLRQCSSRRSSLFVSPQTG